MTSHPHHPPHHDHSHGASHSHSHSHAHGTEVSDDNARRVFLVMLLTGSYMVIQVIGGILSGSLALIADAGHMLSDTAALAMAWLAFRVARRPADPLRSYGWHRVEVLAAFVNGISLFALVAWIVIEAAQRLWQPQPVAGLPMLAVAAVGLLVNVIAFVILHRGSNENVNLRGALLHVLGDLLGSAAAIIAAGVIMATGWTPIDPLLSVLVALLIVRSAWDLVKRSAHILLEGTPANVPPADVKAVLEAAIPDVVDVHHVHVWSLTVERSLMTLHVSVRPGSDRDAVLRQVQSELGERYGVDHVTVQIEGSGCACTS